MMLHDPEFGDVDSGVVLTVLIVAGVLAAVACAVIYIIIAALNG